MSSARATSSTSRRGRRTRRSRWARAPARSGSPIRRRARARPSSRSSRRRRGHRQRVPLRRRVGRRRPAGGGLRRARRRAHVPTWWAPVYMDVDADGPPVLGKVSRQHFKGRLPYHLHTQSTITRLEPPFVVQGDVEGDLRGRGTWTLTPVAGGTHVRFDWQVFADRKLLRALTPVLRPVFRWNHNWAIARAMDGLEPYARGVSATAAAPVAAGDAALPGDAVPSAG